MRYNHVCIAAVAHTLPPCVITSAEIERRLAPVYDRLGLPAGRLELMTGIRERRWFDQGTLPGAISIRTAIAALEKSGLDRRHFGALIHGSVCRDQMEPATAAGVHAGVGLPDSSLVMDVSNACLGLLNGMLIIADQIELGRIRAGIVVGSCRRNDRQPAQRSVADSAKYQAGIRVTDDRLRVCGNCAV